MVSNQAVDNLKAARKLITPPWRWCTHVLNNKFLGFNQYCAVGAVRHVNGPAQNEAEYVLNWTAGKLHHGFKASEVNDILGKKAILHVFDVAIAASEVSD